MEKTNQELANQVEAMNAQRFDSTFYNLISVYHQLVSGLTEKDSHGNPTITGRNVFDRIYKRLFLLNEDTLKRKILDTFKDRKFLLAHYFNHLAEIVSFVKSSTVLDDKMKAQYLSTLRAQISPAESMVIFYYILFIGLDKFQSIYLTEIIVSDAQYVPHDQLAFWYQLIENYNDQTQ